MNKQEFINKVKNMEPPKYFSALTFKEAFNEGFESAKNEVLFVSCFIEEQKPNKHKKMKEIADRYDKQQPITNTPPHYQGSIQPIDLINAQDLNFNLGNVVKYVCRAGKKQGENILSDLEKAKDYINFEIERVKNEQTTKKKIS